MEKIIKEYKTICLSDIDEFDEQINNLLKQGWSLYGNPYSVYENETGFLCQALIK